MIHTLPLATTLLKRGYRPVYILTQDVTVRGIMVPKGFLTDLVSCPRWLRWALPVKRMARAALVHDWLCNSTNLTKRQANFIFRKAMADDGVCFVIRWACWLYVSRPGAPRVRWQQPYIDGDEA